MGYGVAGWAMRIVAFALIASVVGLAQIDRASAGRPALAALVPAGLGGEADRVRATIQLNADPALAEASTRALLRHRPVPESHLSMRALYLVETDRTQEAGAALSAAASRGWRDRYTQITVLGSALANGQPVAAAQRLEALMRHREEWEVQAAAAQQVMSDDAARAAFAERLAESPGLSTQLVEMVERYGTLAPLAGRTFLDASGKGEPIPCEEVGVISRRLLASDEGEEASALWYDRCGTDRETDFAFRFTLDQAGPFDWQFERGKGMASRPGSDEGTISTVNRSPARRLIGYRYASLDEGRHQFRIESKLQSRALEGRQAEVEMIMRCGGRQSTRALPDRSPLDDQFEFDIPADCPQQVISVVSSRGRTTDLKLTKI